MTEIIINPCQDPNLPTSGSGNNFTTSSSGGGTGADNIPDYNSVLERSAYPEIVISAPITETGRNVTILNSTSFFDKSYVFKTDAGIIKKIKQDNRTVLEKTEEQLLEANILGGENDSLASLLDLPTMQSEISDALEIAKSRNLVSDSLTAETIIANAAEYNNLGYSQVTDIIVPLRNSFGSFIDPVRYSSGLLFVNDDPNGLVLANQRQAQNVTKEVDDLGTILEPTMQENFNVFGCPFSIRRENDPTITTPQSPNTLGITQQKKENFALYFDGRNLVNADVEFMNSFGSTRGTNRYSDWAARFANVFIQGAGHLEKQGRLTDYLLLPRYATQVKDALGLNGLNAGINKTFMDITFTAHQAFFAEEATHIGAENFIYADVKVNVASDSLQDGSVIKDFSESTDDELQKKNYYRALMGNPPNLTTEQVCNNLQGRVVKFSAQNMKQFKEYYNEREDNDTQRRPLFSKNVSISIKRPVVTKETIAKILSTFGIDKYIPEMMSDSYGLRRLDDFNQQSTSERLNFSLDQFYSTSVEASEILDDYEQYLEPGEDTQAAKERLAPIIQSFNQSSDRKNVLQKIWTSYADNLQMLNFSLPPGHPLRNSVRDPNEPGLYGTHEGVVNPLEWPLGFRPGPGWRWDILGYALAEAKLKSYLGQQTKMYRSYGDILEGKKSYSEIIGYKIYKYEIIDGEPQPDPVQEFYIMGEGEDGIVDFVDTQVIFEKKYKYQINTINFVVASIYKYNINSAAPLIDDDNIAKAEMESITGPAWSIIEAPLFNRIVYIVDKPPLAPQVNFLPYMGEDKKIRIMLQSNFGKIKQRPIKILPSDDQKIASMREAQEIDIANGKLEYANDSLPTHFQMLRLETFPKKYSDFADSDNIITVPANGRVATLIDEIRPNKDYYYTFRSEDERGISNPGFVYRMRMVSYENGIFMDLKECSMTKKEDQVTIPFRKFFQIEPSNLNKELNFKNVDVTRPEFIVSLPVGTDISLKNTAEPKNNVWGRKFKLRIKSKESGRKVDLLIKFKQETISSNPPLPLQDTENDLCVESDRQAVTRMLSEGSATRFIIGELPGRGTY